MGCHISCLFYSPFQGHNSSSLDDSSGVNREPGSFPTSAGWEHFLYQCSGDGTGLATEVSGSRKPCQNARRKGKLPVHIYPSPPRQNGCHCADNIFKWVFLNENGRILIQISLKFIPRSPIDNKPALVEVMAWCQVGDKPSRQPMMTQFTDIYAALGGDELINSLDLWKCSYNFQLWYSNLYQR